MISEIQIKKAIKGDKEAFYAIIEPIQEKLYKTAFVYVHNEQDALDCVYETIYKAFVSIKELKSPTYFYTWIIKVLINTCMDKHRQDKKIELTNENLLKKITNANDLETNTYENIDLMNAIKSLDKIQRDMLILRYFENMSLKEISEEKNMPLGTVKSHISRGITSLRNILRWEC
ncbi:DNA-directed RNA polymerase sigma-70 factor [Clostridium polyendosporum]|uniref:DNA-directed RNA polymerase sigma-70 factor n=1 Tax=Clostridium polyendosporum TaxID=69208 RepID=A0A919S2C0_9CLOT|nr:sigma-70 family RNA polymerase sigma factor [Clostridium polyendosporum]GIM29303.1 DNA-directed RNA polymerase sigma-70 factor [Clostridium polyendosporum]